MSKPICFFFAALTIGGAPRLAAQTAGQQPQVTIPRATVTRVVAVKVKSKGAGLLRPSASQRAPDASKMVVVIDAYGERRIARAKKPAR